MQQARVGSDDSRKRAPPRPAPGDGGGMELSLGFPPSEAAADEGAIR
jgi:hypothetical protein